MRILANEKIPEDAIDALRQEGHDVAWDRIDFPGSSDVEVLSRAQSENRILVTFDKDFGELAFRWGLLVDSGIILFRISAVSSTHIAEVAVTALGSRTDWSGHFAVIEDDRIRMTPLP